MPITGKVPPTGIKRVQRDDILIPWSGEPLESEEWVAAGKPEMWILCDEATEHKLYADIAYGGLVITTTKLRVLARGSDFVSIMNGLVIALGDYFGFTPPRLFKQINPNKIIQTD
jgi:hypothetical protein